MAVQMGDTLATRQSFRLAITEDIIGRAQAAAVAVDTEGPMKGVEVVSLGRLRQIVLEHLQVALPPPSEHHAEVTAPATVTVTNLCPNCHLPIKTVAKAISVLTMTDDGQEISTKVKTKPAPHVCGQLQLDEDVAAAEEAAVKHARGQLVAFPGGEGGEPDDLRLRILRAVYDLLTEAGVADEKGETFPPLTLDAIAARLELASESDRGDLEESLHAYSQADPPLVKVISAKGSPVTYVLDTGGFDLVDEADVKGEAEPITGDGVEGVRRCPVSALPRGRCPECGGDVALRKGSLVREHRVYLPQAEQDPTVRDGRTRVCPGSGRKAASS